MFKRVVNGIIIVCVAIQIVLVLYFASGNGEAMLLGALLATLDLCLLVVFNSFWRKE